MTADTVHVDRIRVPTGGACEDNVAVALAAGVAIGVGAVPLSLDIDFAGLCTGIVDQAITVQRPIGESTIITVDRLGMALGTPIIHPEGGGIIDMGLVAPGTDRPKW